MKIISLLGCIFLIVFIIYAANDGRESVKDYSHLVTKKQRLSEEEVENKEIVESSATLTEDKIILEETPVIASSEDVLVIQ